MGEDRAKGTAAFRNIFLNRISKADGNIQAIEKISSGQQGYKQIY